MPHPGVSKLSEGLETSAYKKQSKSCSRLTQRRTRKMCTGLECGYSETKFIFPRLAVRLAVVEVLASLYDRFLDCFQFVLGF